MQSTDVAIVGGGVIGSAVACFLSGDPAFSGHITVIERDPTYARASTPRAVGGVRQQFSTRENVLIGRFAAQFLADARAELGVDPGPAGLGFVEGGYLFLASPAGVPVLEANHALQRAEDVAVALLDPAALAARFPWLATDAIALGSLGLAGEGWLDPQSLLNAFKARARERGVTYLHDEAVGIEVAAGRIAALSLATGGRIECGEAVCAAGWSSGRLAAMAGVALPVEPRKRIVYVVHCRTRLAPRPPLTILPSGVFFRPEGEGYVCGVSPEEADDPATDDLELDERLFHEVVWPALAEAVPAFEALRLTGSWAGHYDYNTLDQNGIVGRHPEIANLIFATGFSGHGMQQAPAVGRAVAELIAHGRYRTLDLARFGYERIRDGRPLREANVV